MNWLDVNHLLTAKILINWTLQEFEDDHTEDTET